MVPGFPDTLVAVGRTTGSALNHLLWPVSGELRIDPMSSGDDVTFDRGGRFIALSESVPGLEGSILSMGRFNRMANVSGGVTSYVWHDSETGVLAYTSESDGSWQLFVAGPDLESELLIESPEMVGSLVGFGDWGWAVQMGPDSLALLTPDTHLKAVEPGVGYASHPDGWVFMIDDGPKVVSAGGGVKRIDADLGVGTVTAAAISPDRQYVAVAGATGWTVLNTASGTVEPHIGLSSSSLAWSSDSRFVLSAAGSGVTIYDMDTATPYFVLSSQGVRAVGTAPLRSS
jgi:WD40 repeat protein